MRFVIPEELKGKEMYSILDRVFSQPLFSGTSGEVSLEQSLTTVPTLTELIISSISNLINALGLDETYSDGDLIYIVNDFLSSKGTTRIFEDEDGGAGLIEKYLGIAVTDFSYSSANDFLVDIEVNTSTSLNLIVLENLIKSFLDFLILYKDLNIVYSKLSNRFNAEIDDFIGVKTSTVDEYNVSIVNL